MSNLKYKDSSLGVVYVRVPNWLKKQIAAHCKKQGITVNQWAANTLRTAMLEEKGIVAPPPASQPLPTASDVLADYLAGKKTLEPCGKLYPCELRSEGALDVNGVEWCNSCGIRVH